MDDNREPAFWPWFVSLLGCCGTVGYFLAYGDHVTAFAVTALVLSALSGYCMKASRLLCWHAGLVAAALLTSLVIQFCRPAFTAWLGTSGFILSVIVSGIVAAVATNVALQRLIVVFSSTRPSLKALNRWAGLAIGAGQGAFLCGLVLGALMLIEPFARDRLLYGAKTRDHKVPRLLAAKVIEYSRQTSASAIGPIVARYNPFLLLPPLKEFRNDLLGDRHRLTRTRGMPERTDEHLSAR